MMMTKKILLDLLYNGKQGEQLLTSSIKNLKRYLKVNVNIVVKCRTNKLSMFCPTKDKISWNQKANVIYIILCPGCHNDYVGKKDGLDYQSIEKRKMNPCSNIFGLVKGLTTN